jgi:hypothetical protein
MLILRREQMEVLEQRLFDNMQARVERAIAAVFPQLAPAAHLPGESRGAIRPGVEVRGVVERGIEAAADFGIHEGPDLAAFIALGVALRSGGAVQPLPEWLTGWLNRPETPGPTKMASIEAHLAELGAGDPRLKEVAERVAAARRLAQ